MSDEIEAAVKRLLNALDSALRAELIRVEQRGAAAERLVNPRCPDPDAHGPRDSNDRLAAVREAIERMRAPGNWDEAAFDSIIWQVLHLPVWEQPQATQQCDHQLVEGAFGPVSCVKCGYSSEDHVRLTLPEFEAVKATQARLRDAAQRARELLGDKSLWGPAAWGDELRDFLRELGEEK